MPEHEQHPANVDPHPPSAPSPETREETIAKAVGEADAVQDVPPRVEGEDPSTPPRCQPHGHAERALFAGAGAVVGAVSAWS